MKIAAQLKPLISKFEKGRDEMKSAVEDAIKSYDEIAKSSTDLKGMLG